MDYFRDRESNITGASVFVDMLHSWIGLSKNGEHPAIIAQHLADKIFDIVLFGLECQVFE